MKIPDAAGEHGEQACVPALLEFLGMVPELAEASEEDAPGSVLAGCEQDCKHLAFKALTFLQQVPMHPLHHCHRYHSWMHLSSYHMLYQEQDMPTRTLQSSLENCIYLPNCCPEQLLQFSCHITIVVR